MLFIGRIRNWLYQQQREIFHYHDGTKWRRADPVKIGRHLEQLEPNYLKLFQVVSKDSKDVMPGPLAEELKKQKMEAADRLAKISYELFGLKPLGDVDGVMEGEALSVMVQYFAFMSELAAAAQVFPTSPAAA